MTEPRRHIVFGSEAMGFFDRPKYEVGDERFLRLDWPHPIQIRPVVITDFVDRVIYDPGLWMVVKRFRPGSFLRASVHLPEHLRKNTPRNADRAWRREVRKMPPLAEAERFLMDEARYRRREQRRCA